MWNLTSSLKLPWRRAGWGHPAGLIVLDSQGGLHGVTVKAPAQHGGKPRVLHHASIPGEAAITEANLLQLWHQLGEPRFKAMALLERGEYQIFVVDKANVKPAEMQQNFRFTLGPLLDYPADEANLSWTDVPSQFTTAARTPQVYLVAAKRELVDQRAATFAQAKWRLSIVDIRETSQANIAERKEVHGSGVCLVFADPDGIQITITYQGELYLERFIRESLFDASEPDIETDARREKFDRVALQLQRSLDYVRRNYSGLSVDRLYLGPTQSNIGLLEELNARMLEPLQALDLSEVFEWPEGSDLVKPEVQARYFVALGAALR